MIKIIKRGKPSAPKVYRYKCPNCNCIFECEYEDFEKEPGLFLRITDYYITCPQCGERNEAPLI